MKCFNVLSCHNSFLSVNNKNEFVHAKDSENLEKLFLLMEDNSNYGLLISLNESDRGIKWFYKGWSHSSLLVCTKKIANNKGIAILNPSTKTFLTPVKSFDALGCGKFKYRVVIPKAYEFFDLVEASKKIPSELYDCLSWIVLNVNYNKITCSLIILLLKDAILTTKQKVVIFPNLLSMVSENELSLIVQELKDNKSYFYLLQSMYPNDIWLHTAIPNLLVWLKSNNKESSKLAISLEEKYTFSKNHKQEITEGLDFLAKAGNNFYSSSPGQLINSYFRKNVIPLKRACVLVTIRNEGIYILEWIAYYRALGFDGIYIYSNDNSDGSDKLLSSLADAGLITWINNFVSPKANAQSKVYSHALSILPEILDYKWTLIIDLDEFIVFNKDIFDTFFDFLDWHEQKSTEAIAFNWVYIGSGKEPHWENTPITRRLKNQIGRVNPHIKTMVRTNLVLSSQPHFPRTDEKSSLNFYHSNSKPYTYCNSSLAERMKMARSDYLDDSYACLYHFFFRSAEEFLWKWSRNRGNHPRSEGDIFIALDDKALNSFLRQYNDVSQDASNSLKKCVPELESIIESYLNIPEIRISQNFVVESFKVRSGKVLKAYKNILKEKYGENGLKMLDILDSI